METEVESEKESATSKRCKESFLCFLSSWEIEFYSPSDLGDVVLGDSSLGLAGDGGDGSSLRS